MLALAIAESVLDPRVPLGFPFQNPHPEIGESSTRYYSMKHAAPDFRRGRYYGLHITARWQV